MKEIGLIIAVVVSLLLGGIIVFSFIARTWALFSLQAEEYLMTGSCGNEVFLLNKTGESTVKKEGFLYTNYNSSSLSDIPMRMVLLVDRKGDIKMAVDDIKLFPNLMMMLVAVVCLAAGFFLISLLMGVDGGSFFDNIRLISNADQWAWLRNLSFSILSVLLVLLVVNFYFAVTLKRSTGKSIDLKGSHQVKPGAIFTGEIVDKYTEDVYMDRFYKTVLVPKVCVKVTSIYKFPIILDLAVGELLGKEESYSPNVGDMATIKVDGNLVGILKK